MPNLWTIHTHKLKGGPDKTDLVGCHIIETDTAYQFTGPDPDDVLSTTTGSKPTPPFPFPVFSFEGSPLVEWNIAVSTLTGGHSGNEAKGDWTNNDSPTGDESGTWTAQAGAGVDDEQDASAASA
jgi:hypothetical protein